MTPLREFYLGRAVITVLLVYLLCVGSSMPTSDTGKALLLEEEKNMNKMDDDTHHYSTKVEDHIRFIAALQFQSPAITEKDSSTEKSHHRMKRHTADHLINDRYSRNIQSHVRKQILAKLLTLVGSSPDNPCKCGSVDSANPADASSRMKDRTRGITKRLDTPYSGDFDCNCDMPSLISFLIRRLSRASKSDAQRHNADPLAEYVSRLSNATKIRLAHFLRDEALRIQRYEILRKRRRHRQQMQLIQRRRLLQKYPNAAFHGKIFLSF